jgi:hypothetical protein
MNQEIEKLKINFEKLTEIKIKRYHLGKETNSDRVGRANIVEETNFLFQIMLEKEEFLKIFKETFPKNLIETQIKEKKNLNITSNETNENLNTTNETSEGKNEKNIQNEERKNE